MRPRSTSKFRNIQSINNIMSKSYLCKRELNKFKSLNQHCYIILRVKSKCNILLRSAETLTEMKRAKKCAVDWRYKRGSK
jgi:hypothetical protein